MKGIRLKRRSLACIFQIVESLSIRNFPLLLSLPTLSQTVRCCIVSMLVGTNMPIRESENVTVTIKYSHVRFLNCNFDRIVHIVGTYASCSVDPSKQFLKPFPVSG